MSLPSVAGTGCDDLRDEPINFQVNWQTQIKPLFNEMFATGRCTGCHNPGQFDGNLDLTDNGSDALYKIVPNFVEPGQPRSSYLFDKINCQQPVSGTRMPASQPGTSGTPLTIAQQGLIYDWIAQGALGDLPDEPPIARVFIFEDGAESLRRY